MTSLSVNYSSTSPSTVVPSATLDYIPFQPQHDNYIAVNPVGLPAGTYHIEQVAEDSTNINANIEWALNVATNDYWVRHCTAVSTNGSIPTWSAWTQVNGGGGGPSVTSWQGAAGAPRTGAVVAQNGDYTSTMVTNLSTVPGLDVTTALNNLQAQSGVVSFNGRQGAVVPVAGDYNTTQITNNSTVPGADATAALNSLQTQVNNKVTLGNAVAFGDMLVANAAGDSYVASTPSSAIVAHTAAFATGNTPQSTLTTNGAALEVNAGGGALNFGASLVRASLSAGGSIQDNFSAVLADVGSDPTFGAPPLAQSAIRVLIANAPPATGGPGSYSISVDQGAGKLFFVNSQGQVKINLSGGVAAVGPLFLDANGMICI